MAVGVVTPTVPLANDIILGEFKLYGDHGLPTQTLLGATRGGAKLNIERKIKEIKSDGAYGYMLDSGGIPLVRYDSLDVKLSVDMLYLKYFTKKTISTMEVDDVWVNNGWNNTVGGTYTAETSIVAEGNQSAKITAASTTHGIHKVFTADKNLTIFDNGESSLTSDFIGFSIYISAQDKTDLSTATLRLAFHKDVEGTITNQYYYDVTNAMLTAGYWNSFKIAKSAFSQSGTASWSAVKGVSFIVQGAPGASVDAYIDGINLIQNTSDSAIVPVNGHGFDYTNQTTYLKYIPNLEINDQDYYENITLVGQRHDGKMIKIKLKNVLNDGKISLALKEKDEVVNGVEFTSHYNTSTPTAPPIEIYEYL